MKHYTTNETCKHRISIRYGGRRRQCVGCRATWTIRSKKRGPKPRKRRVSALRKTFVDRLTIAQQSRRSGLSQKALAKRHARTLEILGAREWPHPIPDGSLVLVMDALWFLYGKEHHTIYLMGVRGVGEDVLYFLRPLLRPGHESQEQWQEVIATIPSEALRRVIAIVSDSFSGAGSIAQERGWIFQRCQAHLLLRLETLCGDNKRQVSFGRDDRG